MNTLEVITKRVMACVLKLCEALQCTGGTLQSPTTSNNVLRQGMLINDHISEAKLRQELVGELECC